MEHSFNVQIASLYGIEEAIFIHNLYFWINKNSANNTNLHNGYYWTFNSAKSVSKLFPYIKPSKIHRVVKKLENEGFIQVGNFSQDKSDRTSWYTFTDMAISVLNSVGYLTQYPFCKMKNAILQNEKCILQNEKCIIYTDNKTTDNKSKDKSLPKKEDFDNLSSSEFPNKSTPQPPNPPTPRKFDFKRALLELGVSEQSANDWIIARKTKRASQTQTAFELSHAQIKLAIQDGYTAEECIKMAAARSWQRFKYEWFKNEKINESRKTQRDNQQGEIVSRGFEYDTKQGF